MFGLRVLIVRKNSAIRWIPQPTTTSPGASNFTLEKKHPTRHIDVLYSNT